jgi:hypothetical protein
MPLANILSSVDELNIAGVKISEVEDLIDKEKARKLESLKMVTSTWDSVVLTIVMYVMLICCSCCCCKCCRQCGFWLWEKWTPRECIRHTRERCCVITNINADRVSYHDLPQTPTLTAVSTRSLPYPYRNPFNHELERRVLDGVRPLGWVTPGS